MDPPEGLIGVHSEVVGHLDDPLGSECVLGIDDDYIGIESSPLLGESGVHGQLETDLCLAASELSEQLDYGLTLQSSCQELIERLGSGGQLGYSLPPLQDVLSCLESSDVGAELGTFDDVHCLLLTDLACLRELLRGSYCNGHEFTVSGLAELFCYGGSYARYIFKGFCGHCCSSLL